MRRRTIAVEITQPAADLLREVARLAEEGGAFDQVALNELALQFGVSEAEIGRELRRFADVVERGEL